MPGKGAPKRRGKTGTSDFGTSGRISHDASKFYNSRLYHEVQKENDAETSESPVAEELLDRFYCKSSEQMDELPDRSVHLMITSPPYNSQKQYDQDLTLAEYLDFLDRVWKEVHRVLAPGGRACINVANLGRKPYIPLHRYIIEQMEAAGFLMRGEIIWNKAASASASTAWGSWCSAANPVLRDVHEYILVFSKDVFQRKAPERQSTISKEEFLEWTKSVWTFPAVSARKVGHPAPFPEELPHRLIQLYSFQGDIVLDPFLGSGTTSLAAQRSGRRYVGYDTSPEYIALAEKRLAQAES
jgi:modification methylase